MSKKIDLIHNSVKADEDFVDSVKKLEKKMIRKVKKGEYRIEVEPISQGYRLTYVKNEK